MRNDLEKVLRKYRQGKREDLIPILQEIQAEEGYISEEAIVSVGTHLGLSTTKIYGLATFYDNFRFIPRGKIHIQICHGTSCFINGSQLLIDKFKEELKIVPGQTGRDGMFSLETISCTGGCHHGPVLNINGEYHIHVQPEQIPDLLEKLRYFIESD
jgi:NADH-quinone oxidoreductase subunit E